MPAGFLISRLLLVCLLTEVEYKSIFVTAQPLASQGARSPYDYLPNLPLQRVQHERQFQDAQNPWLKFIEGFTKNRQHPGANHQLGLPEQIQSPYPHLPQIRIKYPSEMVSKNPALEAKKIEFNVNVPVQHIMKTLAAAKRAPGWFRDFGEGEFTHRLSPVSYQEGAADPLWSEHKGLPRDMVKRKRTHGSKTPGLNFRFSAPIPGWRDRRRQEQTLEDLAYLLSQSGLVKQSSPEYGLERPVMGLHPCYGPAQMIPSGCPLVNQGQVNPNPQQPARQEEKMVQQQTPQQQLPILSQILTAGHNSLSTGNPWTEEIAKQFPHFHLSIGGPGNPGPGSPGNPGPGNPGPGDQQKKLVKAPQQKRPPSSGVYPRVRCSHPEVRNNQDEQWMMCPRFFRGWHH